MVAMVLLTATVLVTLFRRRVRAVRERFPRSTHVEQHLRIPARERSLRINVSVTPR